MAITNAQQYKQLLAKGGRIGLQGGGKDAGKGSDFGKEDFGGRGDGPKGLRLRGTIDRRPPTITPEPKPDMSQIQAMLDRRFAVEKPTLGMRARNVADNFLLSRAARGLAGLFPNAPDFVQPQDFGSANQRLLYAQMMAQGPRTMDNVLEEDDEEEEKLEGLRLRFAAEGGSMNDQIRQAMLFGGAVKAVKKAVRGVKKVAKSPIGKAAIVAATYKLGGGKMFGGEGFKFSNLPGFAGLFGTPGATGSMAGGGKLGILGKLGLTTGAGSMALTGKGIGAAITAASLLPFFGLGTGDESEKEAQAILKTQGIDIDAARESILNAGTSQDFRARAFVAEGGKPEPVAKKTMPLLDMGGQEMDLRAEGGFVPIGRMEKADDVPARLSKNEFVFTADAVRNAGDGNVDKGAEVMYNMMKNLEAGGEVSEESQGLEGARRMFQTSQRLEEVL